MENPDWKFLFYWQYRKQYRERCRLIGVCLVLFSYFIFIEFQVFPRMILEPEPVVTVTGHNEIWREVIHKIAPALIFASVWINKMSVPETKQYRSIEDIYLNIGDSARRKMCLVLLLLFIQNIETHKLNHTDLEPRYRGEGPFAPTWVIFAEDKVVTDWYHRQVRRQCQHILPHQLLSTTGSLQETVQGGVHVQVRVSPYQRMLWPE